MKTKLPSFRSPGAWTFSVRAVAAAALCAGLLAGCSDDEQPQPTPAVVDASRSTFTADPATGLIADGAHKSVLTARVVDASGNPISGVTVEFSSTGSGNVFEQPAATGADGIAKGSIASSVAEVKTLTAKAGAVTLVAKPTVQFISVQQPATKLAFAVEPTDALAGAAIAPAVQVSVQTASGGATGSTAAVSIEVTDLTGTSPLSGTKTVNAVNGVATFSDLSLTSAGLWRLTASATGLTAATSASFRINAAPAHAMTMSGMPDSMNAGSAASVTVAVTDLYGNPASSYTGTVHFTSTDPQAALPADYTFTAADGGTKIFTGVSLRTVGARTVTVTDTVTAGLTATSGTVAVAGLAADRLVLTGIPSPIVAGTPADLTVTATDAYGNKDASYRGTITFGPPDTQLPGDYAFTATDAGAHVFENGVVLTLAGTRYVTAEDTVVAAINGRQENIEVTPTAAASLAFFNQPGTSTVRAPLDPITVKLFDVYGNVAPTPGVDVVMSLINAPTANLSGTLTLSAANGEYTFTDLSIDNEGAGYKLQAFAASGNFTAESNAFDVMDTVAPASPVLTALASTMDSIGVKWIATGDDNMSGQAQSYELRYSPSDIVTDADFTAATLAPAPAPAAPWTEQTAQITGLTVDTAYYVALKVFDGAGNSSALNTIRIQTAGNACPVNNCVTPPAPSCSGQVAQTFALPSTCTIVSGVETCGWTVSEQNCAATGQICVDGACVANPCDANPCTANASTCSADAVTLTTYTVQCVPTSATLFECVQTPATQNCTAQAGFVCSGNACAQAHAPGEGDLLVTEVMFNPGTDAAKWFEVANLSGKLLDLQGLDVVGGAGNADAFTVPVGAPRLVGVGGYYVFGASADPILNGGAHVDFVWPDFRLNAQQTLTLSMGSTTVESLTWDWLAISDGTRARNLSTSVFAPGANANAWHWCAATGAMTSGFGSPGAANIDCAIAPATTPIDWCAVQWPHDAGTVFQGARVDVYSRFYEDDVTTVNQNGNDLHPFVLAEVGYGAGADATAWTHWMPATYNAGYGSSSPDFAGNNDEMIGALRIDEVGTFNFGYRFRVYDPAQGYTAYTYCDVSGVVGAGTPTWGTITTHGGDAAASAQITAARAAATGTGLTLPVAGLVTHVKPNLGTGSDGVGFFLQAEKLGPALFVAVDPAAQTPALQAGDWARLTVTGLATYGNMKYATAVSGVNRDTSGSSVMPFVQDVSAAADLVTAINDYEVELTTLKGTVKGAFAAASGQFVAAQLDTAGVQNSAGLKLRLPQALQRSKGLTDGCQIELPHTPMWRYTTTAQASAWVDADLTVTSCPAPKVLSARATSLTAVVVTFDRSLRAESVLADASQFSFTNGLTASAAAVNGAEVTLTTATHAEAANYTVTVAATVLDQFGTAVDSAANTADFIGFFVPSLFISEYVEGSSNNKAVEVFNAGATPVDLSVCTLTLYSNGASAPTSTTTLSGTLAAKDVIVLCHPSAGTTLAPLCDVLIAGGGAANYNGDDALELKCAGTVLDVFGVIGTDPGLEWGTALTSTADNTLRRKCSVTAGDSVANDAFDPAVQWDGFAIDTFADLGSHTYTCP